MNSNRLVQLKVMKELTLDHLDVLRREEVELFGLAFKVGALSKTGMDSYVKKELNNLEKAIEKLRSELYLEELKIRLSIDDLMERLYGD